MNTWVSLALIAPVGALLLLAAGPSSADSWRPGGEHRSVQGHRGDRHADLPYSHGDWRHGGRQEWKHDGRREWRDDRRDERRRWQWDHRSDRRSDRDRDRHHDRGVDRRHRRGGSLDARADRLDRRADWLRDQGLFGAAARVQREADRSGRKAGRRGHGHPDRRHHRQQPHWGKSWSKPWGGY